MIRLLSRKRVLLFLTFSALGLFCRAQSNLYGEEKSLLFIKYLKSTNQIGLAASEYQRLIKMDPQNVSFQVGLANSLLKLQMGDSLNSFMKGFYQNQLCQVPDELAFQLGKSHSIFNASESDFITCAVNLTPKQKGDFLVAKSLMEIKMEQARSILKTYQLPNDQLLQIAQRELNLKKPGLAAVYSMVIPGAGKFYAKRPKDGVFAFVLIANLAYQSISAFNRRGVESAYGWITGLLAGGYYVGNIYGSFKATKQYNFMVEEKIRTDVREVVYSMD